jgi:HlyD family secretion protein
MTRARGAVVAVTLGAVAIAVSGCGADKNAEGKAKKPPSVQAVVAQKRRLVEQLETTGDVVAVNAVTLHATVEGPIRFCPWREGDLVEEAGQKLIEIDRPLYRQEVLAAEAALAVAQAKLADLKAGARPEEIAQAKESVRHFEDCTNFTKADLERTESLVKNSVLPPEEAEKARVRFVECQTQFQAAKERVAMLEAGPTQTEIAVAQAAVDEAAAKRDLAQAKLDECLLTAPFRGVITEVLVRPGDLARPQSALLKMMDPASLVVRAGLPESCAADIREGTEAVIQLDAYPEKTLNAKIERVYPRLEWDSRTRIIEAKIIDAVELIPHLFARVWVRGRVVEDAVVVPDTAIVSTPRGEKVVYVVQDGRAKRRIVTVGLEEEGKTQISGGVRAGEMVITAGNLNLKDGMEVQLAKAAPDGKPPDAQQPGGDHQAEMKQVLLQNRFPIRLREYDKKDVPFATLDELCQYFCGVIDQHPSARYIGTFDHYSHTSGLQDGVIDAGIVGAQNVLFCFGQKLESPDVLSVRPRSIGICETTTQFIISFLEAPSPTATETMERWVREIIKTPASSKSAPAGGSKKS